jgi:hypothetical protein
MHSQDARGGSSQQFVQGLLPEIVWQIVQVIDHRFEKTVGLRVTRIQRIQQDPVFLGQLSGHGLVDNISGQVRYAHDALR